MSRRSFEMLRVRVKPRKSDARVALLSRRSLLLGIPALAFFRHSPAQTGMTDDGLCNPANRFTRHTPWLITFNSTDHPPGINGLPTIRPGQRIRGVWNLYVWECVARIEIVNTFPVTQDRWMGTPDLTHPDWTLALQYERHDVVQAITAGDILGQPDSATAPDFYNLASGSQRVLSVIVKDSAGNVMLVPGTHNAGIGSEPSESSSLQMLLVADTSASIVFAPPTPADGTTLMWKTDTFTVAIAEKMSFTVPGAPFSPLIASGTIMFTDETAISPLQSQSFPYSIAIPVGGLGPIGSAATGAQNFSWPWFDHTPLGGVNGPTSRTVRYDLSGTIADNFGNQYRVTPASRTYQINVSATKISSVSASFYAYQSSIVFGVAAAVFAAASALFAAIAPGKEEVDPLALAASFLLGLGGGVSTALTAVFAAMGAADQANAADPPAVDPNYRELVGFDGQQAGTLAKMKGGQKLWRFTTACEIVTKIYAALTITEGRILGAQAASDSENLKKQQQHLADLSRTLENAKRDLKRYVKPAIAELESILAALKPPITSDLLRGELGKWPTEIPARVAKSWMDVGMSAADVQVIQERVGDRKFRESVLNFSANMQALATHLISAATGALAEANVFLTKRQSI